MAAPRSGWLQKKASASAEADDDDGDDDGRRPADKKKGDPQRLPVFVPLDMFTVNLADREAERYAQIGITLELADAKAGEQMKVYMPAVRNNILMVLAHKTAVRPAGPRRQGEAGREILRGAGVKPLEPTADDKDGERRMSRASARGALLDLHHPVSSMSHARIETRS